MGKFMMVDDEDYPILSTFKWYWSNGYAIAIPISRKALKWEIRAHRLITMAPTGMEVDHINRDRLDNRRVNLRVCTKAENRRNTPMKSFNTSGYKGVSWSHDKQKWAAHIYAEGRSRYLGYYLTKEDAALAYNEAAKKYHGRFAGLSI